MGRHLVAAFVAGPASPVIAVGQSVIDGSPEWLKSFAIRTFGSDDKTALLVGIAVVLAVVAASIGVAAIRRPWIGYAGLGWAGVQIYYVLRDGWIALQPSDPRELVRAHQNPGHKSQPNIGRIVGVGTRGLVGQAFAQQLPKASLVQKMRPDHYPTMSGQPLIGEGNTDGRSAIFGIKIQTHRLVRLLWRRAC